MDGRDRCRRRLGVGLAGIAVGLRHYEIADAAGGGGRVAPVNRREQRAASLPVADGDFEHARSPAGGDFGKAAVGEIHGLRVGRMHLDERLRCVRAEPSAQP
jgi:hypothetical protein